MIATRADLTDIAVSQALFHISMLLPPFLYWVCRTPDADPRFPATISWTIRRGTPKTVQHVCWLAGWLNLSPVLARDWRVLAFAAQMVLTGCAAICVCPVGVSRSFDMVHYVGSLAYMLDHIILFHVLDVPAGYQRGFYLSLAVFLCSKLALETSKARAGVVLPPHLSNEGVLRTLRALPAPHRRRVWLSELVEMISENALFAFFISGMGAGVSSAA
jgi:hypothetical protein